MGVRARRAAADVRAKIYVCHPFALSPVRYVQRAMAICDRLVRDGFFPLCPIVYFPQFVSEAADRETGLALAIQMMAIADEVWVWADEGISAGMEPEIMIARELGQQIRWAALPADPRAAGAIVEPKDTILDGWDFKAALEIRQIAGAGVPIVRQDLPGGVRRYETTDPIESGSYLRAFVRVEAIAPLLAAETVDRKVGAMIARWEEAK